MKIYLAVDGSQYSETAASFLNFNFISKGFASTINVWDSPLRSAKASCGIRRKIHRLNVRGSL